VLVISSNGAEFNPLENKDKYIESGDLSDVSIGGFGITIVKNLCDSISYERKDGKNVLTLEKSITAK
jgi:sigma-B regulation protein RsbU (phosphoserine phosphatase)